MTTLKLEVGTSYINDTHLYVDGYTYKTFQQVYDSPPAVVSYMTTYNGSDPVGLRILDVTTSGCTFTMEEAAGGSHNYEDISYIAVSQGDYNLPNGVRIVAGVTEVPVTAYHTVGEDTVSTGKYVQVLFDPPFTVPPSFFCTLNTFNGKNAQGYISFTEAGVTDVTTSGAKIFQERAGVSPYSPADETIGWVAIDNVPNFRLEDEDIIAEVQKGNDGSGDAYNDSTKHVFYHLNDYTSIPIVFVQMVTQNSTDGAWARAWQNGNNTADKTTTLAEEPYNQDRYHADETFSFMAFSEAFALEYDQPEVIVATYANNIWTGDPYIYKPHATGLSVYDLASEALINYVPIGCGAKTVWADDTNVYVGTTLSGVFYGAVATISGAVSLSPFKVYPDVLSNEIYYVHGKGNYLCVTSTAGVDRYNLSTSARESTTVSGVSKCFQTSDGTYYYIVNPPLGFFDFDDDFQSWRYIKEITLSSPVPYDDYVYYIEIPRGHPYDLVYYSLEGGADVRVVDQNGVIIPFYIEEWTNAYAPKFWFRLSEGTQRFYILYGNNSARSVSSAEDTFLFYDDFNGTELDSSKWILETDGNEASVCVVEDSLVRLQSYSNIINITSRKLFTHSAVDAYIRRTSKTYEHNYSGEFGFVTNAGVYAAIGTSSNDDPDEHPHWLHSSSSQGIVKGSLLMSTDFKRLSVQSSLNYQTSQYGDELLVSSGTLLAETYSPIRFGHSNSSIYPDTEIDWVRVRTYDPDGPTNTVGVGQLVQNAVTPVELHAIYATTSGSFVYTSAVGNVFDTNYINDIHVTENTSNYGGNVIFLATSRGAYVIEERRGNELNCRKRIYLTRT